MLQQLGYNRMANSQSGTMGSPKGPGDTATDAPPADLLPSTANTMAYTKFTNQKDLGKYLLSEYHIRSANELSSCETCHR
jgi:hypothetical protein